LDLIGERKHSGGHAVDAIGSIRGIGVSQAPRRYENQAVVTGQDEVAGTNEKQPSSMSEGLTEKVRPSRVRRREHFGDLPGSSSAAPASNRHPVVMPQTAAH
jgi:hypothetical protein